MIFLKNSKGFTLVELIVVITILAILGTIGFISLQGYAVNARDSTRISDLNTIGKNLQLFRVQEGYYPDPSSIFEVTYSGSLAWKQGTFGIETQRLTRRISQVPVDPLTGNEYAYSITNNRQEYELGAITEKIIGGTSRSDISNLGNTANANNSYFSYIKGDYNKKIIVVEILETLYILGVPTIISTEIGGVTAEDIAINGNFAVENGSNLPFTYLNNLPGNQTHTGASSFTPPSNDLLIFEGTVEDIGNDENKVLLGENLISYYTNSSLPNKTSYSQLLELQPGEELGYINLLVQSDTGGLPGKEIISKRITSNPVDKGIIECMDPVNVGTIGTSGICEDLLIVDNDLLRTVVLSEEGGSTPPIVIGGITYNTTLPNGVYTGQVTNMDQILLGKSTYNGDISYWDTRNVTSMESAISASPQFNQDINRQVVTMDNGSQYTAWNTGKVEVFSRMFYGSTGFDGNITDWDTRAAITMANMFTDADSFNQDIGGWNIATVENLTSMFSSNDAFNQDIGLWDTGSVTAMSNMFYFATAFDQDLAGWCVTNFPTKPSLFDSSATAWNTSGRLPVWGTCPFED